MDAPSTADRGHLYLRQVAIHDHASFPVRPDLPSATARSSDRFNGASMVWLTCGTQVRAPPTLARTIQRERRSSLAGQWWRLRKVA